MKRLVAALPVAAAAAALLAPAVSSAAGKATTHSGKIRSEHHCPFSGGAAGAPV